MTVLHLLVSLQNYIAPQWCIATTTDNSTTQQDGRPGVSPTPADTGNGTTQDIGDWSAAGRVACQFRYTVGVCMCVVQHAQSQSSERSRHVQCMMNWQADLANYLKSCGMNPSLGTTRTLVLMKNQSCLRCYDGNRGGLPCMHSISDCKAALQPSSEVQPGAMLQLLKDRVFCINTSA